MPVSALVTTPGSASANAYVTLAVANQYHLDRPAVGTTWSAATDDAKTAAILFATKQLDALYVWSGFAVDGTQALCWPRNGMLTRNGYTIATTVIPTELQHACAEFARQLLAADRTGDSDIETQGITGLKAGSVELTFKDNVYAKVIPDVVANLIPAEWGYLRNRRGSRDLVRA